MINDDINDIIKADNSITAKRQLGCMLGILGTGAALAGGAVAGGFRQASRDMDITYK